MIDVLTFGFIEKIAIALAIGALLGMERQYSKKRHVVGVRTFSLVSLMGTLFVLFSELAGDQINVFLGFIAVLLLVSVLYASSLFKCKAVGLSTSIVILLSYVLGVFVGYGQVTEAVFITIAVAFVMFAKRWIQRFVEGLTNTEVLDFLEFLALIGIVYPLVPRVPVELYGIAINLMHIWTLVLLLALINFAGFVGSRYIGGKERMRLTALLSGLISSTAGLYSMCATYGKSPGKERTLASAYMFINASMIVRNLLVVAVLLPGAVQYIGFPVMASSMFLLAAGSLMFKKTGKCPEVKLESPFQIARAAGFVIKLGIIITAIQAIVVYLPDIFYISIFMGGVASSSSTMASLPVLVDTGRITMQMAAIGASIATLADLLVGNMIVYYIGGAWESAKRAMPWGLAAAAIYVVVLSFFL